MTDGQGGIIIGPAGQGLVHEDMAGGAAYDLQHRGIDDPLFLETFDEPIPRPLRGHADTAIFSAAQAPSPSTQLATVSNAL